MYIYIRKFERPDNIGTFTDSQLQQPYESGEQATPPNTAPANVKVKASSEKRVDM